MTDIGPNLAKALAAFQGEMPTVAKGKTATVPTKAGGQYTYTYADLADVTEAAVKILSKHGLAFIACPQESERGYSLVGVLAHESGESVTGTLPLHGGTEQAVGSSLTYGRRYLLGCLTGIVTDDDEDGRIAAQTERPAPRKHPREAILADIASIAGRLKVPLQAIADDWAAEHPDDKVIKTTNDVGSLELLRDDLRARLEMPTDEPAPEPEPPPRADVRQLSIAMSNAGYTDRDKALEWVVKTVKRRVSSRNDLTPEECQTALTAARKLPKREKATS